MANHILSMYSNVLIKKNAYIWEGLYLYMPLVHTYELQWNAPARTLNDSVVVDEDSPALHGCREYACQKHFGWGHVIASQLQKSLREHNHLVMEAISWYTFQPLPEINQHSDDIFPLSNKVYCRVLFIQIVNEAMVIQYSIVQKSRLEKNSIVQKQSRTFKCRDKF